MATIKEQNNARRFKGPMTNFSFLLEEVRFTIEPRMKKEKTTQTPYFAIPCRNSNARPALLMIVAEKRNNMAICTIAAILIFPGNLPGYFPPIVNSPKGAPRANSSWKIDATVDKPRKIKANTIKFSYFLAIQQHQKYSFYTFVGLFNQQISNKRGSPFFSMGAR